MNMEIFVKEQCINSVHSVAIYLTLFIFSESVTTSGGYPRGYLSLALFLLYFKACIIFFFFRIFNEHGISSSGLSFGTWLVLGFPVSLLIFITLFIWLQIYFRGCG